MTVPSELAEGPIYLDYNATTPVDPAVIEAMLPYLTGGFGNPSSDHHYGTAPRAALQHARAQVAALIGAPVEGIVFTGSGSEADNLALRGVVLASKTERPHVITQRTEHPAVLEACRALRRWHDAEITYLPVTIGHTLLAATPGIAASTGTACHSGTHTPSPVLTAMGLDTTRSLAALRLSLGRWTTPDDIDHAADQIITAATTAAVAQ